LFGEKGKGKRERGKAIPHGSENGYRLLNLIIVTLFHLSFKYIGQPKNCRIKLEEISAQ
jgi:hypothetical protein